VQLCGGVQSAQLSFNSSTKTQLTGRCSDWQGHLPPPVDSFWARLVRAFFLGIAAGKADLKGRAGAAVMPLQRGRWVLLRGFIAMTDKEIDAWLGQLFDDLRMLPTDEARRERVRYAIEGAYDQRRRRPGEKQPARTLRRNRLLS
jgi:hypothetical protein